MDSAHLRHAKATTTEALAAARSLPVSAGVKALVMKIRGELTVVALRADQTMDNRVVRRVLRSQKLRFARAEELAALGLQPGQVPPFGRPVLPLRLVADHAAAASAVDALKAAGAGADGEGWRSGASQRGGEDAAPAHCTYVRTSPAGC